MEEKYLPIGTVVMLKGGTKRLMISGFCAMPKNDKEQVFDYSGCIFPEGFISSEQVALFNHDQIEKIDHVGLKDEEEEKFKVKLKDVVEKIANEKKQTNETTETDKPMETIPVIEEIETTESETIEPETVSGLE